ncbi:MAG TPA: hypothetical protein ENJ95_11555 [Bacteroidetes bacterium]|nr:hypothetical protein [Bacteroidota bacterium]
MIDFNFQQAAPSTKRLGNFLVWMGKYWFQVIVTFFLFHLYSTRSVQLTLTDGQLSRITLVSHETTTAIASLPEAELSILPTAPAKPKKVWKSSDFGNLTFILNPTFAERNGVGEDIVKEKLANCRKYVKRYAKTAIVEMEKYGIPASITLAQGLLESGAGDSRLAKESNNHFGIKCRRKCRGCTCRNYSDDDVYDMFRVFDSAWESFREHSLLLQIDRYRKLKKLGKKDYKGWAAGLKKAGYATDKNYHKKLIRIIEVLDLHQFDR